MTNEFTFLQTQNYSQFDNSVLRIIQFKLTVTY